VKYAFIVFIVLLTALMARVVFIDEPRIDRIEAGDLTLCFRFMVADKEATMVSEPCNAEADLLTERGNGTGVVEPRGSMVTPEPNWTTGAQCLSNGAPWPCEKPTPGIPHPSPTPP